MKKVVYGISDWPEDCGREFEIFDVLDGETDEEAIARARAIYSPELQCVIRRGVGWFSE